MDNKYQVITEYSCLKDFLIKEEYLNQIKKTEIITEYNNLKEDLVNEKVVINISKKNKI